MTPVPIEAVCRAALLTTAALAAGCTDGATRIAYDIETGVAAFRQSEAKTHAIRHEPRSLPEGCFGPYSVQLGANSSLVIRCGKPGGEKVTASYSTTYHLRFVKVPKTLKIDKASGDALHIELSKDQGDVVVVGLR